MHVSQASAAKPLRTLGNTPGENTGDVVITFSNGDTLREFTDRVCLTDVGVVVSDETEKAVRFIPLGSILHICDAPASTDPVAADPPPADPPWHGDGGVSHLPPGTWS